MKPAEWLRGSHVPTALIAGERDTLITAPRTEGLRRAAGSIVYDRIVLGAGHNDIYDPPEFRAAMHEAPPRVRGSKSLPGICRGGGPGEAWWRGSWSLQRAPPPRFAR